MNKRDHVWYHILDTTTNELLFNGRGFAFYDEALDVMLVMLKHKPEMELEIIEGVFID